MPFNKKEKKSEEKLYSIAIIFNDDRRAHYDFSSIKILENILIVIDPLDEIPCEVHCIPFSSIQSFIFDADALKDGKTNLWYNGLIDICTKKEEKTDGE